MESRFRHMGILMEEKAGEWGRWITDALFPRFCLRCRKEGTALCLSCRESYVLRPSESGCAFCGKREIIGVCDDCRVETFLDGVISLSSYADSIVREAIAHWKYHGDTAYGDVIQRWVRAGIQRQAIDRFTVSFIPLHRSRQWARGFDQGEIIARTVMEMVGKESQRLLIRGRRTTSQARRAHDKRLVGDLDDVFEMTADAPARVLLCDDVFTSGATMDAAAKCLKEAGAKEVWGFVIAKG